MILASPWNLQIFLVTYSRTDSKGNDLKIVYCMFEKENKEKKWQLIQSVFV